MTGANFLAIFGLGAPELLLILAIILLLFGGTKLPQLSRSLGSSMKELRKGMEGDLDEDEKKQPTAKDDENKA